MRTILKLSLAACAALTMVSCCGNGQPECKFSAKDYAEKKTSRLNDIVSLDSKQEKEVYNLYLAQAKTIGKIIKEATAEAPKGDRPRRGKGECPKGQKAECGKPCGQKAECGRGECPKGDKPCCKAMKPNHHSRSIVSPEERKALTDKINALLTPEQVEKLNAHRATRPSCPNIPAQEQAAQSAE
ncbi:MAG: hypothetical protein SOZ00_02435 [Tidjanibacter sp.]|nr:hypothetical protein [Tidjanibacter sp.]